MENDKVHGIIEINDLQSDCDQNCEVFSVITTSVVLELSDSNLFYQCNFRKDITRR